MRYAFALLLAAAPVLAQQDDAGAPGVPPAAEVNEAESASARPASPPKPSMLDAEAPKAEPAPAAKPEPAKAEPAPEPAKEEAKPEPKSESKAEEPKPAKHAAKAAGPEEDSVAVSWAFARAAAEDPDSQTQEAAIEELRVFVRRHPDASQAPEAMLALAQLQQKRGDWQPAMAALLRLLYEYPTTKIGLRAKSDFLTLADKKASRRQRAALGELVRLPETPDRADRLSALWQRLVELSPDVIYEPLAAEIRDFTVRFPKHAESDKLQASLATLHAANNKPGAAVLSWRKLLALHESSPLRPKAQLELGNLYAESLRDPKRAIDAYQELADRYPKAEEVLPALESSARLFDDKLRQYDLAVEMHEKVVTGFPKTPSSLKALKAIAKLQRDRLQKPAEAVKTLVRLSSMHGGQDGVDALLQAADIARRDLKDFGRQAELLRKVSDDYGAAREAAQSLYDAGEVYESTVKDNAKAVEIYKEVAAKFPSHKLAKRASDRVAKLEAAQ